MTRFCIITDEARHTKWRLLINMSLRCFLSMTPLDDRYAEVTDRRNRYGCLNTRIEAYVSIAATPITDACALKG